MRETTTVAEPLGPTVTDVILPVITKTNKQMKEKFIVNDKVTAKIVLVQIVLFVLGMFLPRNCVYYPTTDTLLHFWSPTMYKKFNL